MCKSQIGRALTVLTVLAGVSMQTPAAFGFNSNRVSRHSDGCVRRNAQKETEKAQRRREKIEGSNFQARDLALAFRGHVR
jgi:hypothetical protein